MRRLEDALFKMTAPNLGGGGIQNALMALGSLVAWLVTSRKAREALKPPPPLSSDWIREANDDSAEFRVAAALSGLGLAAPGSSGQDAPVQVDDLGNDESALALPSTVKSSGTAKPARLKVAPPMAAHFAPLDEERFLGSRGLRARRSWSSDDTPPTVVWGTGQLVMNMFAVLERRLVEAATRGLEDKPLASAMAARLADVSVFLSGHFDDARCAALLAGLVWVRPTCLGPVMHASASPVPFAYAALKPVFTPDALAHCPARRECRSHQKFLRTCALAATASTGERLAGQYVPPWPAPALPVCQRLSMPCDPAREYLRSKTAAWAPASQPIALPQRF